MRRVVVVTTGGTIASRWQGKGYAADAAGQDVLAAADLPQDVTTEVVDLFTVNSPRLTTAHQITLLRAVHEVLEDPGVDGVVVTHGTDTLEESAFLLDLHHADRRPVVFTGAQRPLEDAEGDAAGNLYDALLTASSVEDLGTLAVFAGRIHAARGTIKTHTTAPDAFHDPSCDAVGKVGWGRVTVRRRPERTEALPLPPVEAPLPRVDMVMHHADADPLLFDAAVEAGARGIVLVATGAGNATPAFTEAVARAVGRGVLVALTTRVPAGPVTPIYTGGGAVDLIEAGAVPTGSLRAGQSRMAVLAALMSSTDTAERTATLRRIADPSGAPVPA